MLKHLVIQNYALISRLEMQPAATLNIITGETGAGKSIMLGALGLLLGNRADTRALYDDQQKCVVEGTFEVSAYALQQQQLLLCKEVLLLICKRTHDSFIAE